MARRIQLVISVDDKGVDEAAKSAERLGKAMNDAGTSGDGLENLFIKADLKARAIVALTDAVRESFQEFRQFGKEIANLNTLLEGNEIDSLKKGLLELNPNLGQTSELARGMYQALSSGVEAGEALNFIEASAKAARAGLATTFETVDAGTSVMASFGLKGKDIDSIYDKMFETVKRGKVEMSQLAQSIGLVTNIASVAGVSIDEMFGAISTSTRTMRPASAIEGFRSALSNIIKPAKEATDLAEQLGIEFDASALKSKGFAQFLNDVTTATKGNQQQMATLFGDIQALAFVMSVTGNQANQLAEDIKGVSTATGTVDAAFAKQQESLDAQMTTFKNSILQGFTSAFTAIEPILSSSLGFINKYPTVFAAAAIAVGGLTLAYALLNTNVAFFTVSQVPQILAGLKNIIYLMTNLTLVIQAGTAAEIAAMATGWGAVIAVLGIAVYAYSNMETAIDKANKLTLESITTNSQSIQTYQTLAVEAENMALAADQVSQAQTQNGDIHDRLNAILGRLDPATQTYIKSLTDEKSQVAEVTQAIQQNIEVQEDLLKSKLDVAATAILEAKNNIKAQQTLILANQSEKNALTDSIARHRELQSQVAQGSTPYTSYAKVIEISKNRLIELGQENNNSAIKIEEFSKSLVENNIKVIQSAKGLNYNTEQLREHFKNLGFTTQETEILTAVTKNATNSQASMANGMGATNNVIKQQAEEVFNLRDELNKLTKFSQIKVDQSVFDIVRLTTTKAEAQALARKTLENSPDFREMLKQDRNAAERTKAVQEVYSPSERSGGGTKRTRLPNPKADFRRENRVISGNPQIDKLVYQFADKYGIDPMLIFAQMSQESAFKGGAVSYKGARGYMQLLPGTFAQMKVGNNISDPKQNIEAGVKYLRQQLDTFKGNMALALAAYNAGPGAVQKYNGIPPYKETQDYVKRISDRYQNIKGGKFEAGANFDIERSIQENSDRLTKETRDSEIRKAIESAQMTGIRPNEDIIREYNRLQVEAARAMGVLQPTIEQTRKEFEGFADIQKLVIQQRTPENTLTRREQRFSDLRDSLDLDSRRKELEERRLYIADEINIKEEDYRLGLQESLTDSQVEYELLQRRNIAIESAVEYEKQRNAQIREIGDVERDLGVLRAQNANAAFVAERQRLAVKREQFSLEQEITNLEDQIATQGANDGLIVRGEYLRTVLELRNRELDAVISINRAELELSASMEVSNNQIRARVLEHLSQQKTLNESIADGIISTYEAIADRAGQALDKLNEKTKGFLSFIIEPAKAIQRNVLSNITRSVIDKIFPGLGSELTKTNNPVARPVVDKLDETNKILSRIAVNTGIGGISTTGGGRGNWLDLLNQVSGGGLGGSNTGGGLFSGSQGGGIYNASGAQTGDVIRLPNGTLATQINGSSYGVGDTIASWGNSSNGHSTPSGGIGLAGGLQLAGSAASMIGGLIGGRAGTFISNIGAGVASGAGIGAMFGGPVGALIGAGIGGGLGLLQSIFMGDPKRKIDKKENMPKLQTAFTDSFKQFTDLISDVSSLRTDPDGALAKGRELRAAIASGFGIEFQSSKYRKIGQEQIKQQLARIDAVPDGLMQQLTKAVDMAKAAGERQRRILPEFASGVYMDSGFASQYGDFKRRNGMLQGGWTGRDTLPSMLAPGEMVLNPYQQQRVKLAAGFDVFQFGGIPNYADGTFVAPSPSFNVPTASVPNVSAGNQQIVVQPNFTLVLEGATFDENTKAYLESEKGERTIVKVVKKAQTNKELK